MLGVTATMADNADVLAAIEAISKKFDTFKEDIEDLKREQSSRRRSERTLSPHRLWSGSPRRKSPAGSMCGSASRDSSRSRDSWASKMETEEEERQGDYSDG